MTGMRFAPATQALSLDLSQCVKKVWLLGNPVSILLDYFFTGAIAPHNKRIAPLGLAVDANVVVFLFEVHHSCARFGPREKIVRHTIYLADMIWSLGRKWFATHHPGSTCAC